MNRFLESLNSTHVCDQVKMHQKYERSEDLVPFGPSKKMDGPVCQQYDSRRILEQRSAARRRR